LLFCVVVFVGVVGCGFWVCLWCVVCGFCDGVVWWG
jgi:hypothetical protein